MADIESARKIADIIALPTWLLVIYLAKKCESKYATLIIMIIAIAFIIDSFFTIDYLLTSHSGSGTRDKNSPSAPQRHPH